MKIKKGFVKRNIAGSEIVVTVGKTAAEFNGMITLNESGAFFWDCMAAVSYTHLDVYKRQFHMLLYFRLPWAAQSPLSAKYR